MEINFLFYKNRFSFFIKTSIISAQMQSTISYFFSRFLFNSCLWEEMTESIVHTWNIEKVSCPRLHLPNYLHEVHHEPCAWHVITLFVDGETETLSAWYLQKKRWTWLFVEQVTSIFYFGRLIHLTH